METMSVAQARRVESVGKEATLQGWVRTRRDSKGGFSFLELNDGSCLGNVQIVAEAALPNYESEIMKLSAGCSVTVEGRGQGLAGQGPGRPKCRPTAIIVHGWADPATYPLQKKGHSFEFLRDDRPPAAAHQHLRRHRPRAQPRLPCRSTTSSRSRASSTSTRRSSRPATAKGPARCSGSPRSTSASRRATTRRRSITRKDFFGRPAYLTVSGQLEAEIFACALGKVYTFGPTFRAENSNTSRHLAEFWMVEPEMAFFELTDNMDLAEAFLKRIFRDVLERCAEDMQFFQERIDNDRHRRRCEGIVDSQFVRLPYTEAVDILQKSGQTFEFPVALGPRSAGRARALSDREALQVAR